MYSEPGAGPRQSGAQTAMRPESMESAGCRLYSVLPKRFGCGNEGQASVYALQQGTPRGTNPTALDTIGQNAR